MSFNSSLAPNDVKTAIDAIFQAAYQYEEAAGTATALSSEVFKQDSIDRQAVIIEQFMGPGYFAQRAEEQDIMQATARVGNQIVYTVQNWAQQVDVSKNLFDDDQHMAVAKLIQQMARNARLTRDKNAFSVYNGGFTTTLTNDGVALFSNSHVTLSGATVDNLETGVLSEPNLNVLVQSMYAQLTQDGTLGGHVPATLLVPDALFKTAVEITKSEFRQGTANNDLNYYSQVYPGLVVKRSPFLSTAQGGSNTAYFLLSDNHSMYRWVRQELERDLVDYKFQRNNNYVYKAEYREVTGPVSFEGMVGSNGTV